ncbi:uncharacterized protein LOC131674230 [Phymastichus coffea]|uniref:uncharacterized protein LOC131674230 n=1 Tax=Phymastichus coffea TaxID=108790 RepID=UPI00273AE047|nr:uncharacterized protein LOC131674230 [Phymastichus coffea]
MAKSFANGFDVEMGPSRRVMRFLGIYPDPNKKYNLASRLHFLIPAFVMLYFCNVPQSLKVIEVWGDLNAVLDVLTGSDIPIGVSCFKLLSLRYNVDVLSRLTSSMSDDWKSSKTKEELEAMWKRAKLGRLMSIIQISLSGATISAYFIGALFVFISEQKQYYKFDNNKTDKIRTLYLKSVFLYDVSRSPMFEITWILQVFSALFAATSFSSVDAFFGVLVLHLCGQLRNLQEDMKRLSLAPTNSSIRQCYSVILSRIVQRYEYLESFAKDIEDTFNATFLVQMIVSSVVLCLQGYQLVMLTSTEDGIPFIDLMFMIWFTLLFLFSLFIYCYVSEVLRKESTRVADAAYEIDWYNLPVAKSKPLIMIMLKARQPFKITAGKFADISLELYCSILKTSASYLSMLLAVRDRLSSFDIEIGPSRGILRFLGIYPDPKRKRDWISHSYFLIPTLVMFCFCNIPQSVTVIKVWGDLNSVLDVLTTSDIPIGIALFKLLGLRYNIDMLSQLVLSMSNDWKSLKTKEELHIMWKNARLGRLISIIIISLAEGTIIAQFAMVVYFSYSEYKWQTVPENNVTERFRPLYLKADFFYDVQSSPHFEIIWIFQCFSTIFAASSFSAVDAFFAVLVLHLCGQLNNLRENQKSLSLLSVNVRNEESYSASLSRIIERHQYLDRFAKSIENAFNVMFLVQMMASSMVLCLQGYQLVMITTTGNDIPLFELIFMIYFTLCFMFSLFVYCYVAEVLRNESMEVWNAAYHSDWYNLPASKAKLLMIIILRAKQPFQITAGKVTNFSLELYCKILKSSGGYLSMLLAMKDRLYNLDEINNED